MPFKSSLYRLLHAFHLHHEALYFLCHLFQLHLEVQDHHFRQEHLFVRLNQGNHLILDHHLDQPVLKEYVLLKQTLFHFLIKHESCFIAKHFNLSVLVIVRGQNNYIIIILDFQITYAAVEHKNQLKN